MQVPFSRPYMTGREGASLAEVVDSRWVAQGPRVRAFETAWAEIVGARASVATTNGTSALQLALHAAGVGPGDEVVVPSLSFVATANAVWQCGATPVFADIDRATLNITPAAAEAAITTRTRALMPVHQLGLPADMHGFAELASRHGLVLIEDAACAMGAEYRGVPIGGLDSTAACFSLHARKTITTGEGGMISVPDAELAERLRRIRHHGMDLSDLARHDADDVVFESYVEKGWNARMTDLQAALGLCQLEVLDHVLSARRRVAERYNAAFADVPGVTPPVEPDGCRSSWQSYAVWLAPEIDRKELMRALLREGVSTRRGPTAIHHEPAYEEASPDLPETEAAAEHVLQLPIFPDLDEAQQEHVIASVTKHARAMAPR